MKENLTKFQCYQCNERGNCWLFADCETLPDKCPFGEHTAKWE